MPDFARFAKSPKATWSQTLLLPIIGTMGALSPIFVTSAYQQIWGGKSSSIDYDPSILTIAFRIPMVLSSGHCLIRFPSRQVLHWICHAHRNVGKSDRRFVI